MAEKDWAPAEINPQPNPRFGINKYFKPGENKNNPQDSERLKKT